MNGSDNGDLTASFRQKVTVMKNWNPGSAPSNRDKLELYALHKQAISGDAPSSLSTQSVAERAKYQAWLNKAGLTRSDAMRLYLQESDRQLRVYGHADSDINDHDDPHKVNKPQPQQQRAAIKDGTSNENRSNNNSTTNNDNGRGDQQTRGLAAIPLLCAAASESRQAYLRRLANTRPDQAWWGRQEPLTATPGSLAALPEAMLIGFSALLEQVALRAEGVVPDALFPMIDVLRSYLWPTHNTLLSLWMGYVLIATAWMAALECTQTIVWGSRRRSGSNGANGGVTLPSIWKEQVLWCAQSVGTLAESHQTLTARLVGLFLWGVIFLIRVANYCGPVLWTKCLAYTLLLCATWWYWFLILPGLGVSLLFVSLFVAGNCFALIELAGV
ncbi:hypothetical protein ACA910_002939 [Epithemia clementina (nom. ined.)]